MNWRQASFLTVCAITLTAVNLWEAQSQPAPQAGPAPQTGEDQAPPCVVEFSKLREATEKRGAAIRKASEKKVSPQEACGLFNAYTAAEEKMLKYAVDNGVWCGIPPQVVESIKKGHMRSTEMRTKVCRVAAAPARPAAPTLSEALNNPVPNSGNIRAGGGTFDTLTGPPLGR